MPWFSDTCLDMSREAMRITIVNYHLRYRIEHLTQQSPLIDISVYTKASILKDYRSVCGLHVATERASACMHVSRRVKTRKINTARNQQKFPETSVIVRRVSGGIPSVLLTFLFFKIFT